MSMHNSTDKYHVQCSLPDAVRKKPRYDYGPKELTASAGSKTRAPPWAKETNKKKTFVMSPLPFPRLPFLCFKISGHFNSPLILEENFDSWKRGNLDAESHTQREGYVEIHKENSTWRWRIWVMHPQAKECLPLPEASKEHGTDSSLVPSEEAWPLQHLGVVFLYSRTETSHFHCSKPPSLGELVPAVLGN